jgi:hemerythrin-like domain-containing protein
VGQVWRVAGGRQVLIMGLTDVLKQEHRDIERVLQVLERAARHLDAGEHVDPSLFLRATDFVKTFVDGFHHKKEEGVVFPAMLKAGEQVRVEGQEELRDFVPSTRAAAYSLLAGEGGAADVVADAAFAYVAHMRHRIHRDLEFYRRAEAMFQGFERDQLSRKIEEAVRAETARGVPERSLELADALERQASNLPPIDGKQHAIGAVDLEVAGYVVTYFGNFMTEQEWKANSNLVQTLQRTYRDDRHAQEKVRREGRIELYDDPEALRLSANGYDAFRIRTAERILRDHPGEVFLNRCPQCGGLAATPRARQCPHCHHSWHHLPRWKPPAP